jgi:pSer/pThr/pTyr-binding forkhead associated (FHA) protein
MEELQSNHELTTTLHLGLRSVADSSPGSVIEGLLADSTVEEREILSQIINGSAEQAMIVIHRGPSRGARFLITSDGATIGRAPSSDIFLDDVTVSRTHGTISRNGSIFTFTDSGSLNGSYINNQQKSSHQLVSGDEIQIGKFHMLFISSNSTSGEK